MPAKKTKPTDSGAEQRILQLKITLRDSKPPIWRRILVSDTTPLDKLHDIIQTVMGWTNAHLHHFSIAGTLYSDPAFELEEERSEKGVTLKSLDLELLTRFQYDYDFGDNWEHDLIVEQRLTSDPALHYPFCVTGKRACPPEDCGGTWGYAELLEAIRDPEHPEHDDMLAWVGENFDPAAFDLEAVNNALKKLTTR